MGSRSVPAEPSPGSDVGLAQCLADLTADEVVPGSAQLTVGELRIVGYAVTRYSDGEAVHRVTTTNPVPVTATDQGTGESVKVTGRASMVVWQAVEPDNLSGDFLSQDNLQRWVTNGEAVPVEPGSMTFATVFQQSKVTVNLRVRCGESTRRLQVTGTNNPVLGDQVTASVTGISCDGPDTDVSDLSPELAAFARTCHNLV
ncbi:MAG: hypothetical protein QM804_07690 [Propionicimonas sp.]